MHADAYSCSLDVCDMVRLVAKGEDHYNCHAHIPGDDVGIVRLVVEGCGGEVEKVTEGGEVGGEV